MSILLMSPIDPCPDDDCAPGSDLLIQNPWLALLNQPPGCGPCETGGHRFHLSDRGRHGSTGRPSQFQNGPSRICRGALAQRGTKCSPRVFAPRVASASHERSVISPIARPTTPSPRRSTLGAVCCFPRVSNFPAGTHAGTWGLSTPRW